MNKVLQAAGRVIRSETDLGAILLIDERFGHSNYKNLFPKEWFPFKKAHGKNIAFILKNFWESKNCGEI